MADGDKRLVFAFKRLIHSLTTGKKRQRKYGPVRLYRAEVHFLETIGEEPGVSATDLADSFAITKGAVSQIVAKLSKKGLLRKSRREGNLRRQSLELTQKGRDTLDAHQAHERSLLEKVRPELEKCRAEDIGRFAVIVELIAEFVER